MEADQNRALVDEVAQEILNQPPEVEINPPCQETPMRIVHEGIICCILTMKLSN